MGNLGVTFKRFFGNKNTVTIVGVLAGVAVLFFGYNWRVNQAVDPIPVPYATQAIPGNTQITASMVDTMRINRSMTSQARDMITASGQVIGLYARYDTIIPKGSFFYNSMLMREDQLPDAMIRDIPPGFTIYSLPVDNVSASLILPGNFIDLYFTAQDDDQLVLFGKFIESIQVLAVKDSKGQHTSVSGQRASYLNFAVQDSDFILLRQIDYIRTNRIELIPVPRNEQYTDNPGLTQITSQEIVDFIQARAIEIEQSTGTGGFDTRPMPEDEE